MLMVEATLQAKLDHAFRNFWFQNNDQLQAFVNRFITDWNIRLPEELQEVQSYVENRYPYWRVPILIPKPASPPLTPIYPDLPGQKLPERPPGTFWETPAGTWAKDNALWLGLGAIAFWYLLDDKGKKKRPDRLGSATATSLKKRPGNRLYYLWQAHPAYKSLQPEKLHLAKKADVATLKTAARSGSVTLYALYAKNVEEARRKVRAGEGEKVGGGLVFEDSDDLEDSEFCASCADLEGAECCDVQAAQKSPVSEAVPPTVGARRELLTRCGSGAFLMPDGTQARPDVPGYPVMGEDCCYHCGMMRAAYTRIGQALNRKGSVLEKARLKNARRGLIRKAAAFADRSDKSNACNWALAAAKRYRIRLSGDIFPFEFGRVEPKQSELFKVPRGQLVLTEEDIAEGDDRIIQCLERQGWKKKRIKEIQESIAEKMTPSMFTSMTEELTGGEVMYQEAVEKCLQRIRKSRAPKRGQAELFSGASRVKYDKADINSAIDAAIKTVGDRPKYVYSTYYGYAVDNRRPPATQDYVQVSPGGRVIEYLYDHKKGRYETTDLAQCQVGALAGEGCRDAEGRFVPVPQCTGRFIKKVEKEPTAPSYPDRGYVITNTRPEGTKKKGYKQYIVYNDPESRAARKEVFTRAWGLPVTVPGLKQYEFFMAQFGAGWRMLEASTGLAVSKIYDTKKEAENAGKAKLKKYTRRELAQLIDKADKVKDVERYAKAEPAPERKAEKKKAVSSELPSYVDLVTGKAISVDKNIKRKERTGTGIEYKGYMNGDEFWIKARILSSNYRPFGEKPKRTKPVGKFKYVKRHDDITKADVYTMEGLENTIDMKARIFAESKTEYGKTVKRYYPQIDDDSREIVTQVNPDGYLYLKTAKKALEEELIDYLHGDGKWAQADIADQYRQLFQLSGFTLSGEGCRDAQGKFVPVPQCTGRFIKKEKAEPAKKAKKAKPPAKKPTPEPEGEWYASKYPDDPLTQNIEVYKSERKTVKRGYGKGVYYKAFYPLTGSKYWISARELREGYRKIIGLEPGETPAQPEKKKAPAREKEPVESEKGTTLAPWMTAEPFTGQEVSYGNMFSHYTIDWNEDFAKHVGAVEKESREYLEKYGIEDLPPNVLEAMQNYRKVVYHAYKAEWKNRAYYPPVSVVGPSKYPYKRKDKAMAQLKKIAQGKEAAKKRLQKELRKASKGVTPKITVDTHMDAAATNSRTAFGNQYAKAEMAGKPHSRGFEHVYRKRGRELHKGLVQEAMKREKQVVWAAVKEYPELQEYERIIDRPLKAEMPETAHPRIINVKPKGGKPRGYAAFLKMIPGEKFKDAKFQWVWGKPVTIPGFEGYQFFVSKYEGKYYVYEASTGKAASQGRSAMDAAQENARKRLENAKEYFDQAFQQQKKIADYEGMITIYEDMISKIPGKRPRAEPARELSEHDKILELLEAGEMHIDDIGKQAGMEPYQVSAALVMLEIEGRVRQKAGKMFELSTASTSGVLLRV